MTPLHYVVFTALSGSALAGAIRVALGPSLADRIAALDVMLVALMAGVAADAAFRNDGTNLDLIVVIAIVGFTATVAASRFIEHESTRPPGGTASDSTASGSTASGSGPSDREGRS